MCTKSVLHCKQTLTVDAYQKGVCVGELLLHYKNRYLQFLCKRLSLSLYLHSATKLRLLFLYQQYFVWCPIWLTQGTTIQIARITFTICHSFWHSLLLCYWMCHILPAVPCKLLFIHIHLIQTLTHSWGVRRNSFLIGLCETLIFPVCSLFPSPI